MPKKIWESELLHGGLDGSQIRKELPSLIEEISWWYPESCSSVDQIAHLVQKEYYPDIDYLTLSVMVEKVVFNLPSSSSEEEEEEEPEGKKVRKQEKENFGQTIMAGGPGSISVYDRWLSPRDYGERPEPRVKHGAALTGNTLYIYGGMNSSYCFLSDLHMLDLNNWTWRKLICTDPEWKFRSGGTTLPGHSLIAWNNKLLLMVGHTKDLSQETILMKEFDPLKNIWLHFETKEENRPFARGGQSVNLYGNCVVIFGGEDARSKSVFNDLHVLNLETREWSKLEARGACPSPRVNHAAAVHEHRLLIFGGGSSPITWSNDLFVFDFKMREWSRPSSYGNIPTPRKGHAGAAIGDSWIIVGGGTEDGGGDTMVLNMSTYEWSVMTTTQGGFRAGSEGLSLIVSSYDGEHVLVSFGGRCSLYYKNEVNVLKPSHKSTSKAPILSRVSGVHNATNNTSNFRRTETAESSEAAVGDRHDNGYQHVFEKKMTDERLKHAILEIEIGVMRQDVSKSEAIRQKMVEAAGPRQKTIKELRRELAETKELKQKRRFKV